MSDINIKQLLDAEVDKRYRSKPFESGKERLEYFFRMCEKMVSREEKR